MKGLGLTLDWKGNPVLASPECSCTGLLTSESSSLALRVEKQNETALNEWSIICSKWKVPINKEQKNCPLGDTSHVNNERKFSPVLMWKLTCYGWLSSLQFLHTAFFPLWKRVCQYLILRYIEFPATAQGLIVSRVFFQDIISYSLALWTQDSLSIYLH